MKKLIKKIIPKGLLSFYHLALVKLAALLYGFPSEKMVVIGVTGTKGKSTTAIMIGRMLIAAGEKVGWTTTATFRVGEREWLNDKKMTMLGRFALQKLLAQMRAAGCTYAIVETSSEGLAQHRASGINYDLAVFTNLTPEHIEAHGSFEKYKAAKLMLFRSLASSRRKTIGGARIAKMIVANADSEHADEFMSPPADQKIPFRASDAKDISTENGITRFVLFGEKFETKLLGAFNVANIVAAATAARAVGVPLPAIATAVRETDNVPGRMEFVIREPFFVIVDYAHEPASMEKLYEAVGAIKTGRAIQVFGGTGGGRDKARRAVLGEMSGRFCDIVIVTTDDPYDEDPSSIAAGIIDGAASVGKRLDADLFDEPDRAQAIAKALSLARPGDVVLVTGKGSEQKMAIGGKLIPWDDREKCREIIAQKFHSA